MKLNLFTWHLLLVTALLLALPARAADNFTAGYTFSDDTNSPQSIITSNRLRALIESAVPKAAFVSDRTLSTNAGTAGTNWVFFALDMSTTGLVRIPSQYLVSTNLLGDGLGGGGGAAFHVKFDSNTFSLTNDTLTLGTNVAGTNAYTNELRFFVQNTNNQWTVLTGATLQAAFSNAHGVAKFTGTNRTFGGGQCFTNAHGLGAMPQQFGWRLVCLTNDAGYLAGEEIPVSAAYWKPGAWDSPLITEGAAPTNVFVRVAVTASPYLRNRTGASETALTTNYWRLKPYAIK